MAVDAPVEVRFKRITERGTVTDHVSFEEFRAQEDAEYTSKDPNDPNQMNVLAVIGKADVTIINDASLEDLEVKIEEILSGL